MPNSDKTILDLCGGTGAWSRPYKEAGYDVRVITLPEYDVTTWEPIKENIYGILAAPPCSEFSYMRTSATRPRDLEKGIQTIQACKNIIYHYQYKTNEHARLPYLKFWALENSNGMAKFFLGHPTYSFHPYEHGNPYKKRTNIWGWFNAPEKNPVEPIDFNFGRVNNKYLENTVGKIPDEYVIPPGTRKDKILRSITPPGFAQAFFEANP